MEPSRDTAAPHDLSALAWVQEELRKTLETAQRALRRYAREVEATVHSDIDDVEPSILRAARQQLHLGVGALELVNVPEGALLLRTSETLVQRFVAKPQRLDPAGIEAIERGSFALLDYLGRRLAGKPVDPVGLFPQLRALLELCGAERIHPADLWQHDWRWRPVAASLNVQPRAADAEMLAEFEKQLLTLVRTNAPACGMALRRDCSVLAAGARIIEESTLWRLAAGFFDACAQRGLDNDVYVKRTASRVLAQLRTLVRAKAVPDRAVSERLAQDLLFHCAYARCPVGVAPCLDAVRQAYGLVPTGEIGYAEPIYGRFDPAWVQQGRKRVENAKDVWSGVAAGESQRLSGLVESFTLVADSIRRLYAQGERLGDALMNGAEQTFRHGRPPSAEMAMEVATSLLYLEASLEDRDFDHPEQSARVDRLAARLDRVSHGQPAEPLEPWMEELYRRISDRQTMGSVVQELRASLSEVERQIDQFFRNPHDSGLLVPVPTVLGTMRGVLSVLGIDQGCLAASCMAGDVQSLLDAADEPQSPAALALFQRLAGNLGALGFLIDMLSVQPQMARSLFLFDQASGVLAPVMGRHAMVPDLIDRAQAIAAAVRSDHMSLESVAHELHALSNQVQGVQPALVASVSSAKDALEQASEAGAGLHTKEAVREHIAQAMDDFVATATHPVGLEPVGAPLISRPMELSTPPDFAPTGLEDDDEMRGIFLEESREVLGQAAAALRELEQSPADQTQIVTVRRAFHTLKGSSRMVGLSAFGEAAWACEQLYNRWLADQASASAELRAVTADALRYFSAWTDAIAAHHDEAFAPEPVIAAAETLRLAGELMHIALPSPGQTAQLRFGSAAAQLSMPALPLAEPAEGDLDLQFPFDESRQIPVIEHLEATRPAELDPEPIRTEEPEPLALLLDQFSLGTAAAADDDDIDLLIDLGDAPLVAPAAAAPGARLPEPEMTDFDIVDRAPATPELPSVLSELGIDLSDIEQIDVDLELGPLPESETLLRPPPSLLAPATPAPPPAPVSPPVVPPPVSAPVAAPIEPPPVGRAPFMAPPAAPVAPPDFGVDLPVDLPPLVAQPVEPDDRHVALTAQELPSRGMLLDPAANEDQSWPELLGAPPLTRPAELYMLHAPDSELPEILSPTEMASLHDELSPRLPTPPALDLGVAIDLDLAADAPLPVDLPLAAEVIEVTDLVLPFDDAPVVPASLDAELNVVAPALLADDGLAVDFDLDSPELALPPDSQPLDWQPEPPAPPLPPALPSEQFKHIGPLRLPIPLFNIYLNEADELSRRLGTELSEWSMELERPVGEMPIALAHSLAGSSATVGFQDLSQLARELEHALMRSEAMGRGALPEAQLFLEAADEIRRLLHQFAAGILQAPPPDLRERLQSWGEATQEKLDDRALHAADRAVAPDSLNMLLGDRSDETQMPSRLDELLATGQPIDDRSIRGRWIEPAPSPAPALLPPERPLPVEPEPVFELLPEPVSVWDGDLPVPEAFTAPMPEPLPEELPAPTPLIDVPLLQVEVAEAPPVDPAAVTALPPAEAESGLDLILELDLTQTVPPGLEPRDLPVLHDRIQVHDEVAALTAPPDAELPLDLELQEPVLAPVPAMAGAGADQLDPELFPVFREEAEELLPVLAQQVRSWLATPGDVSAGKGCMRTLHTFKGGARLAGALQMGDLAHEFETVIERLLAQEQIVAADLGRLQAQADALASLFDRERARFDASQSSAMAPLPLPPGFGQTNVGGLPTRPVPVPVAAEPQAAARSAPGVAAGSTSAPVAADTLAGEPAEIDWLQLASVSGQAPFIERSPIILQPVRVRAQLLDRLVNLAGEVSITRSRLESEVGQIRGSLSDLNDNLDRLNQQLHDIAIQAETQMESRMEAARAAAQSFDPLEMDRYTRLQELTRMMTESVNDVATVRGTLLRTLQSTEDELAAQARLTRELQSDLLRTRMLEFDSLAERLQRVVRQAAAETGKQVRLDIVGGSIEIDRGVLDRMTAAFEHLLRNCVSHGIEAPEQRRLAGKEPSGLITIAVEQDGNEVTVDLRDDGIGLDLDRIRARAVMMGLLSARAQPTDNELMQLIFAPGLSTMGAVTELAGRGVGMDVVRADVQALGGRIETRTEPGQGTGFKMVLPLTTVVTQVVMLRVGATQIAVPSYLIEVVQRVAPPAIEKAYQQGSHLYNGQALPFYWLGALLQTSGHGGIAQRTQPVVIVRSAQQRVALHVDEVQGNHEVVVKNLGIQLSRVPGLAGMTLLASGAVALIYNPVGLAAVYGDAAQRATRAALASPSLPHAASEAGLAPPAPLVLVVDDSLTVRRVTKRLLEREGYRVAMAKDGLEALDALTGGERPVMVLSDIEMPRMDGFDLLRNIRADANLGELPVVMITSRIAQKHRELALQLGANHYLGKPYSEEELMGLVSSYVARAARMAS